MGLATVLFVVSVYYAVRDRLVDDPHFRKVQERLMSILLRDEERDAA